MILERILISDPIDEIAVKVLDGRNISVDLKTDLTHEKLKEEIKVRHLIIINCN